METSFHMYAPIEAHPDYIAKFWKKTTHDLHALGIQLDDNITVTFGLKKFPLVDKNKPKKIQAVSNNLGGGHHAVILKLENKEKCVFRLELVVEHVHKDVYYVNKNFKCPNEKCNFQTHIFSKLADHHFCEHVCPEGENVYYECCGYAFRNFQSYCQHQYTKHSSKQALTLHFDEIREKSFENFLDQVQFFGAYKKTTSIRHVLQCAVDIILNFGGYWVYCWNCQDFATWYLLLVGVPLRNIDPTLADKLTGSGTQSNAKSIQQSKESHFFKKHKKLKMYDFTELKGGSCCNESGCKWLPPMSIEALTLHMKVAHNSGNVSGSSLHQLFDDFLDIVTGRQIGLKLDVKSNRKYSLYQLRGSTFCSHTSLVFSPWTSCIKSNIHKHEFYHTVEKVIDGTKFKPHMRTITDRRNVEKLSYICDVEISTEELLDFIYVIYNFTIDGTCMEFFVNLVTGLRYYRGRRIIDPSVNEGLLAKYERYRSFTDVKKRRNVLSEIMQFYRLNDEIQEDIEFVKSAYFYDIPICNKITPFERLNSYLQAAKHLTATKLTEMLSYDKEWVCLHPLIAMFLMSINTIEVLFLPMYFVFTLLLIISFGLPLLPQPGLNGMLKCLKGITQPSEWLNILSLIRNVPFVVSLIILAYEVVEDGEMLMSAFIMQYVWTISTTLERDVYKRLGIFHEISIKTVPDGITQLIQLCTRNTIFRCVVAIGLLLPSAYFPFIICSLVIVITTIGSFERVGKYFFTGGLPISLFTFQYLKIINNCIVFLYLLAIASICIQGVIRIPVFKISKFHCIAMYIYTSLSWYIRHKNKLHICKQQAVYAKAVEINTNVMIPNKQLLSPWLSIFRLSILVSSLLLDIICSVPLICVCFLDVHVSLFITFVVLYLHCLLHYFTIDVQHVIAVLIGDALEEYKVSRDNIKLTFTDLLYSFFRFPGTTQ